MQKLLRDLSLAQSVQEGLLKSINEKEEGCLEDIVQSIDNSINKVVIIQKKVDWFLMKRQ